MTQRGLTIITQTRQVLSRGHVLWALAIFALAITLRALWVSYLNLGDGNDGWNYWYAANSLADGNGFRTPFSGELTSNFPPGWPLVLASLIFVFGPAFIAAKVFNIIVGAATAVLVYAIAVRLKDQRTGIVAGGLIAVFPSQIYFTTTLMTETLFVTLSAALVLLLTLWLSSKESLRIWQLLAIGLLIGFMSLVRAETVLLGPALLVLLKLCNLSWRTVIQHLLVIAVGMAIVITPWTVRNYLRFDQVILIRSQSANGPFAPVPAGLSPDYKEVVRFRSGVESPTFSESVDYYVPEVWRVGTQGWRKLSDFFGNDDILYLMEDMATGEIRLSILWEWLHKAAPLTDDDEETGVKAEDRFTADLFARLLDEEYEKLRNASDRDVYDVSKQTTLPIAREIAATYVTEEVKAPWYIDLLNLNLDHHDLAEAKRRIRRYMDAFRRDGTRITENLDFAAASPPPRKT